MFMDAVAYQNAYAGFLEWAAMGKGDPAAGVPGNGIGTYKANPRTMDVLTVIVFETTDGTGNNLTKATWGAVPDAFKQRQTFNTIAPAMGQNGEVPNNSIFGAYGAMMLWDQEAGTAAQQLAIRRFLAGGNLLQNVNSQAKFQWHASRLLNSFASYTLSTDGQAAPASARSVVRSVDFTPLPSVCLLTPGASLSGQFLYDAGAAPAVQTPVALLLHCFAVDSGEN